MTGEVRFRKKLSRPQFMRFMAEHPAAVVVIEACGGASYWARELGKMGHDVRLIAPQYVKPFVKRQKNDAADADAIVVAAQRPEMRFVPPKAEDQQARAALFRARERLVHQRTELTNALRAMIYEYGHVVPQGPVHAKRIAEIIDAPNSNLPELVREEGRDLIEQIPPLSGAAWGPARRALPAAFASRIRWGRGFPSDQARNPQCQAEKSCRQNEFSVA